MGKAMAAAAAAAEKGMGHGGQVMPLPLGCHDKQSRHRQHDATRKRFSHAMPTPAGKSARRAPICSGLATQQLTAALRVTPSHMLPAQEAFISSICYR